MKRLFRTAIILGILVLGALLWFQQSIYFSLLSLRDGLIEGDVEVVEKHADLDKLSLTAAEFLESQASHEIGELAKGVDPGTGGIAEGLIKGAAGLLQNMVGGDLKNAAAAGFKATIKSKIKEGTAFDALGGFKPVAGFAALGSVSETTEGLTSVNVRGKCKDTEVEVRALFERVEGGPMGILSHYRAVGVEGTSLKDLAAHCDLSDIR